MLVHLYHYGTDDIITKIYGNLKNLQKSKIYKNPLKLIKTCWQNDTFQSLKGVILIKIGSLNHMRSHLLSRDEIERVLNFVQLQKIWTLWMAIRFKLVFIMAEKFSSVYQSKRLTCLVSITAIANIWNFVLGIYMGLLCLLQEIYFRDQFRKDNWISFKLQELHFLYLNFNVFLISVIMRDILPLKVRSFEMKN